MLGRVSRMASVSALAPETTPPGDWPALLPFVWSGRAARIAPGGCFCLVAIAATSICVWPSLPLVAQRGHLGRPNVYGAAAGRREPPSRPVNRASSRIGEGLKPLTIR
jgi:hypothetical protein